MTEPTPLKRKSKADTPPASTPALFATAGFEERLARLELLANRFRAILQSQGYGFDDEHMPDAEPSPPVQE